MKTILFNLHDLVLVSVLVFCTLLAGLSAANNRVRPHSKGILAALFLLTGMIALDTLAFWGEGVKYAAFELSPWLLTFFSFAAFAFGPTLYWLVRTELAPNTKFPWLQLLHLAPAIATPIYLYWVFYRHPPVVQRDLILNLTVYSLPHAHFLLFITLKKLSPLVYGVASLWPLWCVTKRQDASTAHYKYLLYLTAGFTFISAWVLFIHLGARWLPFKSADFLGLIGNYLTLLLLFSLVILSFSPVAKVDSPEEDNNITPSPTDEAEECALALQLQSIMETQKPYLNPRLTLERFSEILGVPTRQVSNTINRQFKQNFQEYINRHRVEEAKRLLNSADFAEHTILEIAQKAGFNSKPTFNRIFKTITSVTPSHYRESGSH